MPRLRQTGKTAAENRIQRVVGYARVSTFEQAKHCLSPTEQQRKVEQHCALKNMKVAAFFVDVGLSGNPIERPEFKRMMSFVTAPKNQIFAVIISNSSRLTRDTRAYLNCLRDLEKAGVRLLAAEPAFPSAPDGTLMIISASADQPA
jgi:DNA invertase Pin-like site-specific DNA recombinase